MKNKTLTSFSTLKWKSGSFFVRMSPYSHYIQYFHNIYGHSHSHIGFQLHIVHKVITYCFWGIIGPPPALKQWRYENDKVLFFSWDRHHD